MSDRVYTLSEFKQWLEGFEEAVGDAPTPAQWAKIRERLDKVVNVTPSRDLFPHIHNALTYSDYSALQNTSTASPQSVSATDRQAALSLSSLGNLVQG